MRAFGEAGAQVEDVKLGIGRSQRELSDLWCRLIMPLNITALEGMKAFGFDLLGNIETIFHRSIYIGSTSVAI